jgi:hypothetical protein
MIVVLSENAYVDRHTLNGRELHQIAETARLLGCRVYPIPCNFDDCGDANNALAYVPSFSPAVFGVWVEYIPDMARYTAIFEAALAKGVRLMNDPAEFQTALEFDRFYPLLGDLTPQSIVFTNENEIDQVEATLAYPVFIKGAVKSNKDQASQRVGTPFMVIDVGQLETGEWIVIEVGDGQFAGLSQVSMLELWSKLSMLESEQSVQEGHANP